MTKATRCLPLAPHMLVAIGIIIQCAGCLTREDVRTTTIEPEAISYQGRTSSKIRLSFKNGTERDFVQSRVGRFGDEVIVWDKERELLRIPTSRVKRIQLIDLTTEPGKNLINVQVSSSLFSTSLTLNYERVLGDQVSVSAGFGYGTVNLFGSKEADGYGGEVMAHLFWGDGPSKFELALGLAAVVARGDDILWLEAHGGGSCGGFNCGPAPEDPGFNIMPSTFIGYRYQPNRGLFYKLGLAWSLAFGLPLGFAVGAAF